VSPQFVLFGPSHLAAIALTLAVPLTMALVARHEHLGRHADRMTRIGLALLMLGGWAFWFGLNAWRGELTLERFLPMHLCDWAQIALMIALVTRNQLAYELGYFWGLGGTLQGVITPTVYYDFPDAAFIAFFIQHGGVIAALLYLTLGARMRPTLRSIPRVIAASLVYLAAAGLVDWLFGVNYGFLREKPAGQNLLSVLADWPWYIPQLVGIGFVFLGLYYLPFALADGWRTWKARRPERT
jgi:hypothetical integral membrane protein (TIGR02206 family)